MSKRKKKGFTLIEIMVVITIIIILAGLLMPAFTRARRQAKRVECINNLKNIGIALHAYALDNNGAFPPNATEFRNLVTAGYLDGDVNALLNCPENLSGYAYNAGLIVSNAGSLVPIVSCPSNTAHVSPNPVNTLYGDGHVASNS